MKGNSDILKTAYKQTMNNLIATDVNEILEELFGDMTWYCFATFKTDLL